MNTAYNLKDTFNYSECSLLSDIYYVICIPNKSSIYTVGNERRKTIFSDTVITGFMDSPDKIVHVKNITIKQTLVIDIGFGHINLDNVHAKNIIVKSAGFRSVNFLGNSIVENLIINTDNPVRINAEDNSNGRIDNIILAPTSDTLERSTILLEGDFGDSNIIVETSLTLIAGENFRVDNPILITGKDDIDRVNFTGDFSGVPNIIITSSMNIIGQVQSPPTNLKIEVESEDPNNILLQGNLESSFITFNTPSTVNCEGTLGNVLITDSVGTITMNLSIDSSINEVVNYATLKLEGYEASVNEVIDNTHNIGSGKTLVTALQRVIGFESGQGIATIQIPETGNYKLKIKVQEGEVNRTLNDELYLSIIE